MKKLLFTSAAVLAGMAAQADLIDREGGIKIGQRMTLRPYVSFSYSYDTNVDSANQSRGSSSWCVNPGLSLDYRGGNWNVVGTAYYNYSGYTKYNDELQHHNYGEQLSFDWSSVEGGKGWSLMLSESIQSITQNDDMTHDGGKGLGRDRFQINLNGALNYRFNEQLHAGVNGGYHFLDYANDSERYGALYGWSRWDAGAHIGYTLTRWTDFFISGTYNGYTQDNDCDLRGEYGPKKGNEISGTSKGYTIHGGIGSYLTDRIQYRVSAGMSHFEYGDISKSNGFTYQGDLNWQITETLHMMLLASSYYQPSEREYGASTRNDCVSWGVAKSFIRGKLNATFDVAYRHEMHDYVEYDYSDYYLDIVTFRLGLSYSLNRFFSIFGSVEYQTELNDGNSDVDVGDAYDYDRWRGTIGVRLAY